MKKRKLVLAALILLVAAAGTAAPKAGGPNTYEGEARWARNLP